MPRTATDFRDHGFDAKRIDAAGKDVGKHVYWKLYAIENLIRIVVHSVLTAQLGGNWWDLVADPDQKKEIAKLKRKYSNAPWHSAPGRHEVYYIYLSDLTKILTANSPQFAPHIPDIDQWTARLEQIRVPRNVVGHMNWLTATDRVRIDVCYSDIQQLVAKLATSPNLPMLVP
jgi:hypothetical protein